MSGQWTISLSRESFDSEGCYTKPKEAIRQLKILLLMRGAAKPVPVEIGPMGYDDITIFLPPDTPEQQVRDLTDWLEFFAPEPDKEYLEAWGPRKAYAQYYEDDPDFPGIPCVPTEHVYPDDKPIAH